MSTLPKTWRKHTIRELCTLINGRAFKPSDWSDDGLPIVRIQNLNNHDAPYNFFEGHVDERFIINNGQLLFAWSGTPGTSFGAHIWKGGKAILNQHIFKVIPNKKIVDTRYLEYAINETLNEQIEKAHGGVGLRHVTKGRFEETIIFVPPLRQQCQIVARLDAIIGQKNRAQVELDKVPNLIRKYREAILAKAFSGELSADFNQKSHPSHVWKDCRVGDLVSNIVAGKNVRCEERPPKKYEKGVVKVSAVTWGSFDPSASKTFLPDYVPSDCTIIRDEDFLISRANTIELVGAVVIVDSAPGNLYLSDKILRLEMKSSVKKWLLWFLRSPHGRRAIESSATGNQLSMRNLSQSALRSIVVPWPDEKEREEIVRRIETAFAWLDRVAAEHANASRLLPKLEQAILAKAFRGELVPQESAESTAAA